MAINIQTANKILTLSTRNKLTYLEMKMRQENDRFLKSKTTKYPYRYNTKNKLQHHINNIQVVPI